MNIWKRTLITCLFLLLALPVMAQDDETVAPIAIDNIVEETLTQKAFFDWWQLQATQGDILVIDMAASGGLEPLIGILDSGGDLVARSEDGAPDSTVTLEYTVETTGQHTIVATRVGNADGTTEGSYTLRLRQANSTVQQYNPYQDVTFRCDDYEVTTASTFLFQEDPVEGLNYRITVYGIDGFEPVIRVNIQFPAPYELCNTDAQRAVGDTFTLPGEPTRTITDANLTSVSQLLINGADKAGVVTMTIGSKDGKAGRYILFIEGFTIEPSTDIDAIEARVGPLSAKTTAIQAYMIDAENSRLDPFITRPETEESCDDAGRKGCETVPSFTGAGATMNEGEGAVFVGDRSDAGLLLNPGNPDPMVVEFSSRNGRTHGKYVMVFIGELPPRPAS